MKRFLASLTAATAAAQLAACNSDTASLTSPAPRSAAAYLDTTVVSTGAATGVPVTLTSGLGANICLADPAGNTAPGTPLIIWTCNGYEDQKFTFQSGGQLTLASNAGLCLDAAGAQGRDGDAVVLWGCTGGANQRWTLDGNGQIVGINGKCLAVPASNMTPGTELILWHCNGYTDQQWTATPVGGASPPPAAAPAPTSANVGGSAELPRTYLDTSMPSVTGRTINVAAGGDLQAALDAAQPGDQVVLAPGATFVGMYELRPKSGMTSGQWITVRSGGTLPAPGTRVGPGDAGQMPKLLTPNNWGPALATTPGAQGWRVVGMEISAASGTTWNYSFVNLGAAGGDQNRADQVPSRIVLDRVYVHANSSFDLRRCVTLNSAASAVIDSYLADCHSRANDSQAIVGWNGPGPYKIVNNYLEGGHEVVMFGGNDPSLAGVVPSDIELRRNHVTRPLSWRGVWQVKNLLEFKTGQRLLVEGNVLENNWLDAQNGFAFVWWSATDDCSWCVTQDVTFRYNRVKNVQQAFNLADRGGNTAVPMSRVTIAHNVITGVDASGGRMVQIGGSVGGLTFQNNSGMAGSSDVYFTTPWATLPSLVYRDNVGGSPYNLFADGGYMGNNSLSKMGIPPGNVTGNVLYSASGSFSVPSSNSYVGSASAIGFTNLGGGDLTLSSTSPYLTAGTGGARPGADVAAVDRMTAGVVR